MCLCVLRVCLKVGSRPTEPLVTILFVQQQLRDVGHQLGHDTHSLTEKRSRLSDITHPPRVLRHGGDSGGPNLRDAPGRAYEHNPPDPVLGPVR